jgi:hypothetical protein
VYYIMCIFIFICGVLIPEIAGKGGGGKERVLGTGEAQGVHVTVHGSQFVATRFAGVSIF